MTKSEQKAIIERKELPKDELDNFGDNVMGYIPFLLFLVVAKDSLVALLIVILLILYTFYCKTQERKLIAVPLDGSATLNWEQINKIAGIERWKIKSEGLWCGEYYIPFVFGQLSHKLTVLMTDDALYLNIRNIGTSKGRFPYLFGTDTICRNKVIRLFENHLCSD